MYTRNTPGDREEIRIPENYRGNAFHGDTAIPSPPIEPPPPPVPLPNLEEDTAEPIHLPTQAVEYSDVKPISKRSPFSPLLPPRLSSGGLLGDIGIEELLIIGILVLLSQSETDDDILLLLLLLLFYR